MPSEPEDRGHPTHAARAGARWRWWPWAAAAGLVLPALWVVNRRIPPPQDLGLQAGRLRDCPDRPNCAGSECSESSLRVEPLRATGSLDQTRERLRRVVGGLSGARLIRDEDAYLHFEFTTRICRFVDDVEFRIDPDAGVIHCRSASRVGYSDLGANRRRLEEIRRRWISDASTPR